MEPDRRAGRPSSTRRSIEAGVFGLRAGSGAQIVDERMHGRDLPEAEPLEDRPGHPPGLRGEERRTARDCRVPAGTDESPIAAETAVVRVRPGAGEKRRTAKS
jgi:hypothetical protein